MKKYIKPTAEMLRLTPARPIAASVNQINDTNTNSVSVEYDNSSIWGEDAGEGV